MTQDKSKEQDGTPEKERVDRELIELLNELRVALPGVQVLFAFLLILPFSQGFERVSAGDRRIYFFAVVTSAIACMLLIAPSAHHRMRFRDQAKEGMIKLANVLAAVGLFFLSMSIASAVYLIASALYRTSFARWVGALLALATLLLWFVVPRLIPRD